MRILWVGTDPKGDLEADSKQEEEKRISTLVVKFYNGYNTYTTFMYI